MRVAEMREQDNNDDDNDYVNEGIRSDCQRTERRIRRESEGKVSVTRGRFGSITKGLLEERQRYAKDKKSMKMRVEYMSKVSMTRSRFEFLKKCILRERPRLVPRRAIAGG